jgi:hypothetical protein
MGCSLPEEIYWLRSDSTYVSLLDTTSAAALCRTDVTAGSITSNRVARAAAAPHVRRCSRKCQLRAQVSAQGASVSSGRETIGWGPRPGPRETTGGTAYRAARRSCFVPVRANDVVCSHRCRQRFRRGSAAGAGEGETKPATFQCHRDTGLRNLSKFATDELRIGCHFRQLQTARPDRRKLQGKKLPSTAERKL